MIPVSGPINALKLETDLPFVSVITPFYNSAETLEQCIDSVLAQSHRHFEYVLADNRSTDGSAELARARAALDKRIRFLSFDEHVPQRPNYNRALRHMACNACYCKIVQADDRISKDCLEQMLRLAARYPSIGVIGAVREVDGMLDPAKAERIAEFTPGRKICRQTLIGDVYAFGSPTSVMYRADLVRARPHFFNPDAFFDDTDVVFDLLWGSDFGFCQQTLSYTTRDPNSQFGRIATYDFDLLYRYMTSERIGGNFFTATEAKELCSRLACEYYEALTSALWRRGDRGDYLKFHRSVLRNTAGMSLSLVKIARAFGRVVGRSLKRRMLNFVNAWWEPL